MLVVDASVAVAASHTSLGFASLRGHRLVAPYFLLVEASSTLHEMVWRREIEADRGKLMMERILTAPVELVAPSELTVAAWRLAEEFGWAKTYDAHYVALAQLEGGRLLTLDERLIRGIARLGIAVRPREL